MGGGHVMRCLALARALIGNGWECALATRRESIPAVPALDPAPLPIWLLESGDEAAEADEIAGHVAGGCDFLMLDHYGRGADFEKACREWARKILVLDDLADRAHVCDYVLNQNTGRQAADYDGLLEPGCRVLAGADYALIDPSYRSLRKSVMARRRRTGRPEHLLITLGAQPDSGTLEPILSGALDGGLGFESIHLVVSQRDRKLEEICKTGAGKIQIHHRPPGLSDLMARADLAVCAAGATSWERCCLGLPAATLVMAPNQKPGAAALSELGAGINLGEAETVGAQDITAALRALSDPQTYQKSVTGAAGICDGRGPLRVELALNPPLGGDGQEVGLHPAGMGDLEKIYEWQSTPGMRRHFNNPDIPTPGEHESWLLGRLEDEGAMTLMVTSGQTESGLLLLDQASQEDRLVISILMAPKARKQGIASAALAAARRLMPEDDLWAEIKPENTASLELFAKQGYAPNSDGWHLLPASPCTAAN